MYEDISIMEISMRTKTLTKTHAEDIPASFQRMVPKLILQNERVAKKIGMLGVDVQTLHLMVLHDGPLTPSTVVALSELPASTTTRVLDRLEQRGFIRRAANDKDQRSVRIELDWARVAPVRALFDEFAADFRALSASFNTRDQAAIARFMQGVVALL
ncbi:MAG: MarR family transcriptional regulator [Bradyrhizobiaceae bacterium]|jgi:DNA-binding MarR family transcriptional regulator|nr:MAG: MarR family transcriptional regulator [Bradyrhizobiaceae bacterium]